MSNQSDEMTLTLRRGVEVGNVDSLVQALRNAHKIAAEALPYPLITSLELLTYGRWYDDYDEDPPKPGIRITFESGDKA